MRVSQFFISTLKEAPSEAELPSHKLMLRAGYIRKLASGLYTWMPLGLRVLRKVENIVREEMDKSGGIELLMPAVQPAELWHETGRWAVFGPQMLKIKDRHDNDFCFGPTHEEVITDIARREIRSYRQLPVNFYQVQTKFRDEVRPRFGVMRGANSLLQIVHAAVEALLLGSLAFGALLGGLRPPAHYFDAGQSEFQHACVQKGDFDAVGRELLSRGAELVLGDGVVLIAAPRHAAQLKPLQT